MCAAQPAVLAQVNIDDVISAQERTAFMAGYKAAAGFAIETLNKAPPTIENGARAL